MVSGALQGRGSADAASGRLAVWEGGGGGMHAAWMLPSTGCEPTHPWR